MSFIYSDTNRTTLSSYDIDKMKKNADGGVTIYVGPKAPQGLEANWIPTAGKRPLPAMRLYGPTDALNQKTFKIRISRSSTDARLSALTRCRLLALKRPHAKSAVRVLLRADRTRAHITARLTRNAHMLRRT